MTASYKIELVHVCIADSTQSIKASNVTRPFPMGSGDETNATRQLVRSDPVPFQTPAIYREFKMCDLCLYLFYLFLSLCRQVQMVECHELNYSSNLLATSSPKRYTDTVEPLNNGYIESIVQTLSLLRR